MKIEDEVQTVNSDPVKPTRIELVDALRGVALLAMTLFHFGWDLEAFGFVERGFTLQPAMVWFARGIASSFLILVGVSLVLAHQSAFNSTKFLKRFAMVAGAALIITIATYFATPNGFIFFGILHHIALASVLGLVFLKFPWWINIITSACILLAALYARTSALDAPLWWWTGLSAVTPVSNDYVPIFPFFAAVLFGIALTQFLIARDALAKFYKYQGTSKPSQLLKFIGKHSLVYYIVHQPIMIGILYVFHMVISKT